MSKTVLILGAGIGGIVAANRLRQALPKNNRVVLVDREPTFLFAPSLLWLMTGDRTAERISRPLASLRRKGVEFVHGTIERIDIDRREAIVDGRTLAGDYLIIALGAELDTDAIPGLGAAGHNLYSLSGADGLRADLVKFAGGKLVVLTAAPAYKCPAAPYEAAMLLESHIRHRRLRAATSIDLFAAEPGPMGVAGPEVSKAVRQMVESKGIAYHANHQIVSADPAARQLRFANGVMADYDLLAYVPPHRAPRVIRESGLATSGWMAADRHTLRTGHEGVYALGDVVSLPLALGRPLPRAGVFAHAQAEVVARNIAREVTGRGRPALFDGHGACFVETGDGRAGYGAGNFYAEPVPNMRLRAPGRFWHLGKVLFEQTSLRRWF